jgi:hypothetical protein
LFGLALGGSPAGCADGLVGVRAQTNTTTDAGWALPVPTPFATPRCADRKMASEAPPTFVLDGCAHTTDAGVHLAIFRWKNYTGRLQVTPYGPDNGVAPGAAAQGQPESFPIGGSGQFAVLLEGSNITWTILGHSMTIGQHSGECGESCQSEGRCNLHVCGSPLDTCRKACGDGMCTEAESCRSCPRDCDCASLEPLVDCVRALPDGSKLASFGYRNSANRAAAISRGPENRFSPGEENRNQPTFFEIGEMHHRFQVQYSGPDPTWTIAGRSATVGSDTPLCADECAASCPHGASCIGTECLTVCGDGLCADDEGCLACADCACGTGQVCWREYSCAHPTICGVEAYCGVHEHYGVRVDCGSCPDGLGCVSGECLPMCSSDAGVSP